MSLKWWGALAILTCALVLPARAQQGNTVMFHGTGAPTGTCAFIFLYTDDSTGNLYNCLTGTWHLSGSGGTTSAPNVPYYYLMPASTGCGSLTNCTAIFADGAVINDGTTTSTTTVTCPNSDCNFTQADVG